MSNTRIFIFVIQKTLRKVNKSHLIGKQNSFFGKESELYDRIDCSQQIKDTQSRLTSLLYESRISPVN